MADGMIADVQRASLHDGSGIRTTVFFKGCPLACKWCHNPECISFAPQIMTYPEKCIGCHMCGEGCYTGAKVVCGKKYSVEALLAEIIQDKNYYDYNGGVTFSGGEPLAQNEFLNDIIDRCKALGINCAVETSLIYYDEKIFKKLDFVMADLKIWNDELHRRYTGVGNGKIKSNFLLLDDLNVPIVARTPVIPGIEQGIDKISSFMKKLGNVKRYELLPYHPLGIAKSKALGVSENRFEVPSKEYMEGLSQYAYIRC